MQVTVESTGALQRKMRVELPAERIEQAVASKLRTVGRTAKLKGFRPGKVPPQVIRQRYGKQVRQEVLADIMQQSYGDAVRQQQLQPAGGPQIETEPGDAAHFAYTATFEIMPVIKLQNLDGIAVEKPEVGIADSDLDAMIETLRRQKATWSKVERAAAKGDRLTVDFTGTLKGEPIEGGQGSNVPVILGEGSMLPDFEKGLSGVKAGDAATFKVKFPKDYHAPALQGKKAEFAATIHSVEEQILPPVDDSLAELFSVTEGGLQQFKQDVRENMRHEAAQKVHARVREQLLEGLLAANPIDIPQALVSDEIRSMQKAAMQQLGIEDETAAPPADCPKMATR